MVFTSIKGVLFEVWDIGEATRLLDLTNVLVGHGAFGDDTDKRNLGAAPHEVAIVFGFLPNANHSTRTKPFPYLEKGFHCTANIRARSI